MLGEKLLGKSDYDCERDIRTLELLKLRFGDANLHACEARPCLSPPAASPCSARQPPTNARHLSGRCYLGCCSRLHILQQPCRGQMIVPPPSHL